MERPGIYGVLLLLLVAITCYGQRPDLIIRYGKSYPARPRPIPKSPFYSKRNEVLPNGNNGFSREILRDTETNTGQALNEDGEFADTPFVLDPFSVWRSQRQRMTRPRFLRD